MPSRATEHEDTTESLVDPLTYWVRLADIIGAPGVDDRLIEQASLGLLLVQAEGDLTAWLERSGALLDQVDTRMRATGGPDDVVELGRAAPAVVSLRSLVAALTPPRSGTERQMCRQSC